MSEGNRLVVLITGATDGLGKMVAERLARKGAVVLMHGRNPAKGEVLADSIRKVSRNDEVHYYNADLASLHETKALAQMIAKDHPRLDVLVNNAGIGPVSTDSPRRTSPEGHELFFAVNYLSGCLLARELLPLLRRAAPARIINVASIGQQPIDFANVMLEREYDDARAYRQSKLAQILFTFDLADELKDSGVTVNALHPATLMPTGMVANSKYFPGPMNSLEQGADALEHLILSSDVENVSGAYFDGMNQARANDQAYDAEARRRLRELTALAIRI